MAEPLKNGLNPTAIQRLAHTVQRAHPSFDVPTFLKRSTRDLGPLELKERVAHVAHALRATLPDPYPQALAIVVKSADHWQRSNEADPLHGFAAWPLFSFVELYGLDHFELSLDALRDLTHLFTAEFALRPYLAHDPKKAFKILEKWTKHPSEHVRRLVSEGTRPRLPWARKVAALIESPHPGLRLLEQLKDDRSEYVRRSVGNHLNDVTKDQPDLVISICEQWLKDTNKNRRWIVERATRTLVKDGHPGVWPLLGFPLQPKVTCSKLKITPRHLQLGGTLDLSFTLHNPSKRSQKLAIDYALHFVKADGATRPKVFKLKVLTLDPGETLALGKRHPIKPITTRKYYAGEQGVELLINGQCFAQGLFTLRL